MSECILLYVASYFSSNPAFHGSWRLNYGLRFVDDKQGQKAMSALNVLERYVTLIIHEKFPNREKREWKREGVINQDQGAICWSS